MPSSPAVALERLIVKSGRSQLFWARKIGVSQGQLSQYLTGQARPSHRTAVGIQRACGISHETWLPEHYRLLPRHPVFLTRNGKRRGRPPKVNGAAKS